MSDGNNIKNDTTGKTEPFQQQKKYEVQSVCSKVMSKHPLNMYVCAYIHIYIYVVELYNFSFLKSVKDK